MIRPEGRRLLMEEVIHVRRVRDKPLDGCESQGTILSQPQRTVGMLVDFWWRSCRNELGDNVMRQSRRALSLYTWKNMDRVLVECSCFSLTHLFCRQRHWCVWQRYMQFQNKTSYINYTCSEGAMTVSREWSENGQYLWILKLFLGFCFLPHLFLMSISCKPLKWHDCFINKYLGCIHVFFFYF